MGQDIKLNVLPLIPEIEPELREVAECAAGSILKSGGKIPHTVGIHVREIDWWYRLSSNRYINAYSHLSTCKYLRSLDAANSPAKDFYFLKQLEYLETLRVGRYKLYDSKYGRGPTNESIRKHWEGVGCYEIKQNPLYRRIRKKRDKPLPGFTDIEWVTSLTLLKELSIEVHDVIDYTPLSKLKNLEVLKLHGVKSLNLEMISQLENLKELELYNCAVEDLSVLGQFENLKKLSITRCNIGFLAHLPESLTDFHGYKNRFNDVIITDSLPNLNTFSFLGSEIKGKEIGLDRLI